MREYALLGTICVFLGFLLSSPAAGYEEVEPGQIVTSPEDYVGRYVTMAVTFGKVNNVFRGWEEQANLRQTRMIKFVVSPLREIACYADKAPDNEKIIGGLQPGQTIVISGYLKKCRAETKVKSSGERGSVTRKSTTKGVYRYAFIVKKIEAVEGAAAPPVAPAQGVRRRRRRGL